MADAAAALAVVHAAFAAQPLATDPPSAALAETTASLAARLAAGGGAGAVGADAALLGVVFWEAVPGALVLSRLAVLPAARRQGIAAALVGAAAAAARAQGFGRLRLSTRIALADNHRLFGRLGFREVGRTAHPGHDAATSLVMECGLA